MDSSLSVSLENLLRFLDPCSTTGSEGMGHPGISNKGISSDTSEELRTIKKSLSRCQTRLEVRDYVSVTRLKVRAFKFQVQTFMVGWPVDRLGGCIDTGSTINAFKSNHLRNPSPSVIPCSRGVTTGAKFELRLC